MHIETCNLSYHYRTHTVIDNLNLQVCKGAKVGLLGPNGCGKTTLLKLIAGLIKPSKGEIYLDSTPLVLYKRSTLASEVGLMMQHAPASLDLTVKQVVALGRMRQTCPQALQQVLLENDLNHIAHFSYNQLSGGQHQRVMFAQLQYQNPRLSLFDEPANHLDINHTYQVLSKIKQQSNTSIASYHCFNLAARFCDQLVLMKQGKVLVTGDVEQVLTPYWIKLAYDVDVEILRNSRGTPMVSIC